MAIGVMETAAETLIYRVVHKKTFRPMTIKIDGPLVRCGTTAALTG